MTERNPFYGATFAERKAIRDENAETKAVDSDVDEVENKAVAPKATTRKRAPKKG